MLETIRDMTGQYRDSSSGIPEIPPDASGAPAPHVINAFRLPSRVTQESLPNSFILCERNEAIISDSSN
jgi:hypothetical protein